MKWGSSAGRYGWPCTVESDPGSADGSATPFPADFDCPVPFPRRVRSSPPGRRQRGGFGMVAIQRRIPAHE